MSGGSTIPLIAISYPSPSFKIREEKGRRVIWDNIRKRFVTLSVEEWVRQNFIAYLIQAKGYPSSLMAIEKEIRLGDLKKRCDIVVYKDSSPWMIVECKEPQVRLNEKALRQILGYNITLRVPYLILTNGDTTHGLHSTEDSSAFLTSIPDYR